MTMGSAAWAERATKADRIAGISGFII